MRLSRPARQSRVGAGVVAVSRWRAWSRAGAAPLSPAARIAQCRSVSQFQRRPGRTEFVPARLASGTLVRASKSWDAAARPGCGHWCWRTVLPRSRRCMRRWSRATACSSTRSATVLRFERELACNEERPRLFDPGRWPSRACEGPDGCWRGCDHKRRACERRYRRLGDDSTGRGEPSVCAD